LSLVKDLDNNRNIKDLLLLPKISWYKNIEHLWQVGENEAQKKLDDFLKYKLIGYKENRNYPAKPNVSKLSPHLTFGEISPNQIWYTCIKQKELDNDLDHFLSEIAWREFSYYLLYHFPQLPSKNFQSKFDHFQWEENNKFLTAWQKGQTGYPIVDAGMRELWQTGYIHNRVRMVVASFLVKNLLLDWRYGARWFWDCLLDADLANNSASWQWVAGCGADAAPYFRIFNPVTQGEKFDSEGKYTKLFVPELTNLPAKYLFQPWVAPNEILQKSGVILGENYPEPIVDLVRSRNYAIKAYKDLTNLKS
jgi:deoxyribodipyrimidine photo-lyase